MGISDLPFSSSDILSLELFLPPIGAPMNITILDYPISSIHYISQVPSTYPIYENFPMDIRHNIYVVSIDNDYPNISTTVVQLLRDKQNALYPPLSRSTSLNDILLLLPNLRNTKSYFNKAVPSWNLSSKIMKSSPLPPLGNLKLLVSPSRYPTGSTRSNVP